MYPNRTPQATPPQGIALPIALAAVVAVGALIAGVVFAATQEYRVGSAAVSSQKAHHAAEAALNSVFASWQGLKADTIDVGKSVALPDTVIDGATVERDLTRISLTSYWVTATASAGGENIQRKSFKRLHTIIRLQTPDFKIMGAVTGRGLDSIAGSGKLSGVDTPPPGWDCPAPGPTAAGLVVGDSALTTKSAGTCQVTLKGVQTETFTCVEGDPKVKDSTALVNDTSTYNQFGSFNYDSLARIADKTFTAEPNGTAFSTVKPSTIGTPAACNYGDPNNWGDTLATPPSTARGLCQDYYPIIHLKGDGGGEWLLSNTGGQGILLVDGNLKLAGRFQWTGLILAKGYFKAEGASPNHPKITGAVMAMNSLVPLNNIANSIKGDAEVQFSRCAVNTIMAKRSLAAPMRYRAWADLTF